MTEKINQEQNSCEDAKSPVVNPESSSPKNQVSIPRTTLVALCAAALGFNFNTEISCHATTRSMAGAQNVQTTTENIPLSSIDPKLNKTTPSELPADNAQAADSSDLVNQLCDASTRHLYISQIVSSLLRTTTNTCRQLDL